MRDFFESSPKTCRSGTHRVQHLETTFERVSRFARAMGITRVANVTGLDSLNIPVVMVTRPAGLSLSVYQGKGSSLLAAKVSGIMEAIERYHGETASPDAVWSSHQILQDACPTVDPRSLPKAPQGRFSAEHELPWTPVYDLMRDEHLLAPLEAVAFQPTFLERPWSGCFRSLSTGLAAGNSLSEATVHALCEVVERDAQSFWMMTSAGQRRERRIDPATIDDPGCWELLEKYAAAKIDVGIFDATHEIGVPTFVVFTLDAEPENRPPGCMAGWGTHPCREIALSRALTESAQSRLTQISGARDDMHRRHFELPDDATLKACQAELQRAPAPRRFGDVESYISETVQEDLAWLLRRLASNGLPQVLVSDLTREEFGIPVVRVLVPWAEDGNDVPGYVPGPRLSRFRVQQGMRGKVDQCLAA